MKRKLTIAYQTELQRAAIQAIFNHLRGIQGRMNAIQTGYLSFSDSKRVIEYEEGIDNGFEADVLLVAIHATLKSIGLEFTITSNID